MQNKYWHISHFVMCVGMFHMFLPNNFKFASVSAYLIIYISIATIILGNVLKYLYSHRLINFLWIMSLVDMAAMIYMISFYRINIDVLTDIFIAYFVIVMVVWLIGEFNLSYRIARESKYPPFSPIVSPGKFFGGYSVQTRVTLSLMAAGMGYMLFVMRSHPM
ncbi:DUF5134 domain-containing protein [Natrialbaceae archaeon GCM10025810]